MLAEARKGNRGALVFPGTRPGAMMGNVVMTQALRNAGVAASGHGCRSSFKGWAWQHDVNELLFGVRAGARGGLGDRRRLRARRPSREAPPGHAGVGGLHIGVEAISRADRGPGSARAASAGSQRCVARRGGTLTRPLAASNRKSADRRRPNRLEPPRSPSSRERAAAESGAPSRFRPGADKVHCGIRRAALIVLEAVHGVSDPELLRQHHPARSRRFSCASARSRAPISPVSSTNADAESRRRDSKL